jgi:hypothetical protein
LNKKFSYLGCPIPGPPPPPPPIGGHGQNQKLQHPEKRTPTVIRDINNINFFILTPLLYKINELLHRKLNVFKIES